MNASALIVSQALIRNQDGVTLHPDLFLWEKELAAYKQRWFHSVDRSPIEWFAALQHQHVTALLALQVTELPVDTSQCWLVMPYHGQLQRDSVRLYPEGLMPWSEADAIWLCETLNPFLAEDGMLLFAIGAALLLSCRDKLDTQPVSFASISGKALPDRHHEGPDGGKLNRLLAEIQMLLHSKPSESRIEAGEPELHGIWIASPTDWPLSVNVKPVGIATRNPFLASIVDGRDAELIISEAERLQELVKQDMPLPKKIILAGEGQAVLLTKSMLPRLGKVSWNPKAVKAANQLLLQLNAWL